MAENKLLKLLEVTHSKQPPIKRNHKSSGKQPPSFLSALQIVVFVICRLGKLYGEVGNLANCGVPFVAGHVFDAFGVAVEGQTLGRRAHCKVLAIFHYIRCVCAQN